MITNSVQRTTRCRCCELRISAKCRTYTQGSSRPTPGHLHQRAIASRGGGADSDQGRPGLTGCAAWEADRERVSGDLLHAIGWGWHANQAPHRVPVTSRYGPLGNFAHARPTGPDLLRSAAGRAGSADGPHRPSLRFRLGGEALTRAASKRGRPHAACCGFGLERLASTAYAQPHTALGKKRPKTHLNHKKKTEVGGCF
jgi:hypothetical protein